MAVDHSNCCQFPTENITDAELDPEFELDFDPTLNSCCERDRANQMFELRAKEALKRVDRVDLRTRLENSVLGSRPGERALQDGSESSLGDSDGSLENDVLLERLRMQRLNEIQKAAPASFGSGTVSTIPEAQALDASKRKAKAARVAAGSAMCDNSMFWQEDVRQEDSNHVIHLAAEGDPVGQEMDEHLDQLAHECRDLRFLRVVLSRQSRIPPLLGMPHAPAILVFKEGALTAKALIARFTKDGTLLQEQVSKFLRQAGVSGKEVYDSGVESEEGESSDWQEPCEICGRRYFHAHINNKPIYRSMLPEQGRDDEDRAPVNSSGL